MDVLAVREACRFAKNYSLENGPIVLEMVTYRYGGHSMSDPGTTYRTREEIQWMRSHNDPITGLRERMLKSALFTEEELKDIEKKSRAEVDAAVEKAKLSPEPPLTELFTDIYAKGTSPKNMRGRTSFEIYNIEQ